MEPFEVRIEKLHDNEVALEIGARALRALRILLAPDKR